VKRGLHGLQRYPAARWRRAGSAPAYWPKQGGAGATFEHVAKAKLYLTDMSHLADYVRVKPEFVTDTQPASTAIEAKSLAFPGR